MAGFKSRCRSAAPGRRRRPGEIEDAKVALEERAEMREELPGDRHAARGDLGRDDSPPRTARALGWCDASRRGRRRRRGRAVFTRAIERLVGRQQLQRLQRLHVRRIADELAHESAQLAEDGLVCLGERAFADRAIEAVVLFQRRRRERAAPAFLPRLQEQDRRAARVDVGAVLQVTPFGQKQLLGEPQRRVVQQATVEETRPLHMGDQLVVARLPDRQRHRHGREGQRKRRGRAQQRRRSSGCTTTSPGFAGGVIAQGRVAHCGGGLPSSQASR